jgi:hypothetical protein
LKVKCFSESYFVEGRGDVPCCLLDGCQYSGGTSSLHFRIEDSSSSLMMEVAISSGILTPTPNYTASQSIRISIINALITKNII